MEECDAPAQTRPAGPKQPVSERPVTKDQILELDPYVCLPRNLEADVREKRENHTLIEINSSHNYSSHQCSYSKVDKGSTSCGYRSGQMTPLDYNDMMERGFRRCGEYFYKQDNMKNHWPYYTIRSDATQHKIRKSHQKAWNRWQRYLAGKREVVEPGDDKEDAERPETTPALDTNLESLQEVKHRIDAAFDPITKELAGQTNTQAPTPEEAATQIGNLKNRVNAIPDKQVPGAFFSNILVLIMGYYKLNAKEVTKNKEEYLRAILSIAGFDLEVQPNGMTRWKKQLAGQMDLENPQPKANKSGKSAVEESSKPKLQPKHLEIKLVPAACTTENFDLYKRYCADIHESKKESQSSYENFLCHTLID